MNRMHNFFNRGNSFGNSMGNMFSGNGNPLGNIMGMMQMFNQFKNDPLGALMSMGYNIPQNVQGSSEAIVNYLRNSGQMSEQQFNQLASLANQFQNQFMKNNR